MDTHSSLLKALLRFIAIIMAVLVSLVLLVVLLGWQMGWEQLADYARGMQFIGLLAIGIGLLGVRGNWEVTRSFGYQYSMSTTKQSGTERTQQILTDFVQSYTFMLVMFMSGGLSLLVGWFIESKFI